MWRASARSLSLGFLLAAAACSDRPVVQESVASGETASALEQAVNRMMSDTALQAATGFTASTLVAPGTLSDPLALVAHAQGVWVNDGGREDGERGGEIFEVDKRGRATRILDTGRTRPLGGFGLAPAGFGAFGGQIFALVQPRDGARGAQADHVLLRWPTPQSAPVEVCSVPTQGALDPAVPGGGISLVFGPAEGPFADRLFAAISALNTVFELQPTGRCEPFVTLGTNGWERPLAMAFSPAGDRLLLGAQRAGPATPRGVVLQIAADGRIDRDLAADGVEPVWAMAIAPASFAGYAGELFLTAGDPPRDLVGQVSNGALYRVTGNRTRVVVAAGFLRPTGLAFVGDSLWVADARGRRVAGQRLPDGFIVAIRPEAASAPRPALE